MWLDVFARASPQVLPYGTKVPSCEVRQGPKLSLSVNSCFSQTFDPRCLESAFFSRFGAHLRPQIQHQAKTLENGLYAGTLVPSDSGKSHRDSILKHFS